MTTKQVSDVHFSVTIHPLTMNGVKPNLILLTHNVDATIKSTMYTNPYDSTTDYPENGPVHDLIEAAFDVKDFHGPLEVLAVPNTDIAVPYNTTITPTDDGGKIQTQMTPGIIYAMGQHLYDGAYYAVPADDITAEEITQLSDFLYQQRRVMLMTEVPTVADLKTLSEHVKATATDPDTLGNTTTVVNSNTTLKQAIQIAAYAASNMPVDVMHIGNLSQLKPDETLTGDDYDQISALNGTTVVNKSDDMMMLAGKALAGNYADQFVHMQYTVDAFTNCLQKYMNRTKFPSYDDDTIAEMEKSLETTGKNLVTMGILYAEPTIEYAKRADVPNNDVAKREYNYFAISCQLADDIEIINGKLDITL